jgi:hypothetical protein
MNLRNKYYRYFCEISSTVGIPEEKFSEEIISLDIGEKSKTQNYTIRLKQKTESHGQILYHICVYDDVCRLVRNDPIFLIRQKRENIRRPLKFTSYLVP